LGNGLKAIYQIEFGIATSDRDKRPTNGDRGDAVSMRNTFAGLAGDWGTFLVGRHDTPLKISTAKLDLFADTMGDYNGPLAFDDVRADNTIAYISPSWSGFQLAAAIIPGGCATSSGNSRAIGGEGCGATVQNRDGTGGYLESDSIAEGYSIAAIYSNGPWYAGAAYEGMQAELGGLDDGFILRNGEEPFDDYNKWRIGLGIVDWNGFSLTGIYEARENTGFVSGWDTESWQVQAGYAFGNSMIKASYGQNLRDLGELLGDDDLDGNIDNIGDIGDIGDGDLDSWSIGFDHNFSKRTKVYAIYTGVNDELDQPNYTDWQGFSMGVVHKF
jgi:predicted porin